MFDLISGIRVATLFLGLLGLGAPSSNGPAGPPKPAPAGAGKPVVARPAAPAPKTRKWAIVIGVGKYDDPDITEIAFCNKDAIDLAGALRAQGYEVICLTDQGEKAVGIQQMGAPGAGTPSPPAGEEASRTAASAALAPPIEVRAPDAAPTRESILQRVGAFLADPRIGEKDLALVYFSGHGFANEEAAYLAARDTDLRLLGETDLDMERLAETGVSVKWLRQQVEKCRARQKVLILDSCHSGTPPREAREAKAARGAKLAPAKAKLPAQDAGRMFAAASAESGMVTLASCKGSEASWQKGANSAFTFFLLEGLKQAADSNRDGQVGVMELNKYVHDQVVVYAKDLGVDQTPVAHTTSLPGDITLAECPIPKAKSNTLLYVGGAAAVGGLAVALGGSGSSGGDSQQPQTATVSGYVYAFGGRAGIVDRALSLLGRSRGAPKRLILREAASAPVGFSAAEGATVSTGDNADATTDKEGKFSKAITLPAGTTEAQVRLTVSFGGYPSISDTVNVQANTGTSLTVGSDDIQEPTVKEAARVDATHVDVSFSEPLQAAGQAANYTFDPPLEVKSAQLKPSAPHVVVLETAEQGKDVKYTINVKNVQDTSGNTIGSIGNTGTFTGNGVPPTVEAVAPSPSSPDDLVFRSTHVDVTFNEEVNAEAGKRENYTVEPPLTITAAAIQADRKKVRLTTAEQKGQRSYTLTVANVADLAGNPLDPEHTKKEFTGVGRSPRVDAKAQPVSSTQIDVSFDEKVVSSDTSVPSSATNQANYTIVPSGAPSATSLAVTKVELAETQPSGGTTIRLTTAPQVHGVNYTVTVKNVTDLAENPVDATANSATFDGLDTLPPQIVQAEAEDSTHVKVTFNEAVQGDSATPTIRYTIVRDGDASKTLAVTAVELVKNEAGQNTGVRLTTGEQAGGVVYLLTIKDVQDLVNNAIQESGVTTTFTGEGESFTVDQVSSVEEARVRVIFNRSVEQTSAEVHESYVIKDESGQRVAVNTAKLQGDGSVRLETAVLAGGKTYTLEASGIKDTIGNSVQTGSKTFMGLPLQVASAASDGNGYGVRVVFNRRIDADSIAQGSYTLSPSLGTVTAQLQQDDGKVVLLTTTNEQTDTDYEVTVGGVTDLRQVAIDTSGSTHKTSFKGAGVAPQVMSAAVDSTTAEGAVVEVTFSEEVATAANTYTNYTFSLAEEGATGAVVEASAAERVIEDKTKVRITTNEHTAGVNYTVTVANVTDLAGNALGAGAKTARYEAQAKAPLVLSAGSVHGVYVAVEFNEPIKESALGTYSIVGMQGVTLTRELLDDKKTVRIATPDQTVGTDYTLTIEGVQDLAGNSLNASTGFPGKTPPEITLTASHQAIAANGSASTRLTVKVTKGDGSPWQGASISLSVEGVGGTLDNPAPGTNQDGDAYATLTAPTTSGKASLSASLSGLERLSKSLEIRFVGAILFNRQEKLDGEDYYRIWAMDRAGANPERLSSSIGKWNDVSPKWSPDGTQIAFASNRAGNTAAWAPGRVLNQVYVAAPQGIAVTQQPLVTSPNTDDSQPSWKGGTGRALAFSRQTSNSRHGIWFWNYDTKQQYRLSPDWAQDARPEWSADGAWILFSCASDGSSWGPWAIYAMRLGGGDSLQQGGIQRYPLSDQVFTNDWSGPVTGDATWSPPDAQGRLRVAFIYADQSSDYDVYVMDWDAANPKSQWAARKRLTTLPPADTGPAWSPDGRTIVFESSRSGGDSINLYSISVDTPEPAGQPVALTTYNGVNGGAHWSWGSTVSGGSASVALARSKAPQGRIFASAGGQEATASLTAAGLQVDPSNGRSTGLRFVPLPSAAGHRSAATGRSWAFALEAPSADSDVTLTWPNLSGLGRKERIVLEDVDANVRRNMRTSTSYVFRGESRRFRVAAEKRSGAALMITDLALESAGRGNARVARVTLSEDADLDLDVITPTGALLAEIARAKPLPAGTNRLSWRVSLPPGLYILRARARSADATVVQSVRPVVIAR